MQTDLAQLLYDLSANIADWSHPVAHQIAIASVVMIGLLLCCAFWFARDAYQIGQLLEHASSMAETDWQADLPPWPMQDAASAESRGQGPATGGGGIHRRFSRSVLGEDEL